MQRQISYHWLGLIILAGIFIVIYLESIIFPGRINPAALQYFSLEQAQSARAYSFVPRLLYISNFFIQAAVLIWLVFSGKGASLARWLLERRGGNLWTGILLYFILIWALSRLLSLPFTLYSNYFWQHVWGLSNQSLFSWWQDYFKSSLLDLVLATSGVLLFFFVLLHWPKYWWVIGASLLAFWLILQNILWPVIVAPLFNHFEPVKDPQVINMVKSLADKAGIQVNEVLVMDASQRTTTVNAYFSGLGKTKQIVIYDNLLENYPLDEVGAVLAHEMAHWQKGHIIKGLVLGIIANYLIWGFMVFFLRDFTTAKGPCFLQTWAAFQLFIMLIMFVANPLQNFISRKMEIEADQVALGLTGDSKAMVRMQIDLTIKNKSDVSPPDFLVWFEYTHPPVLSRIKKIGG